MMKISVEHGNICRVLQEKKDLTGKYFQTHLFRYWNHAIEQEALQQNLSECVTEKMLSMQLSTLKRELLEEMESIYGNAIPAASQTGDHRDEMEQEAAGVPETDMSNAMMTMALAMGDWVPE